LGAYVIVLLDANRPDTLIGGQERKSVGDRHWQGRRHFSHPMHRQSLSTLKKVVYVNDYELAILKPDELILKNLGNEKITPFIQKLDLELASIEKGGYDHFMIQRDL
jgi:glucosamine--fructose-6-phosphate aminotransferase (isomerizing)